MHNGTPRNFSKYPENLLQHPMELFLTEDGLADLDDATAVAVIDNALEGINPLISRAFVARDEDRRLGFALMREELEERKRRIARRWNTTPTASERGVSPTGTERSLHKEEGNSVYDEVPERGAIPFSERRTPNPSQNEDSRIYDAWSDRGGSSPVSKQDISRVPEEEDDEIYEIWSDRGRSPVLEETSSRLPQEGGSRFYDTHPPPALISAPPSPTLSDTVDDQVIEMQAALHTEEMIERYGIEAAFEKINLEISQSNENNSTLWAKGGSTNSNQMLFRAREVCTV